MDRVTRCLRCGKRTVPVPGLYGKTELQCIVCDRIDPLKTTKPISETPLDATLRCLGRSGYA